MKNFKFVTIAFSVSVMAITACSKSEINGEEEQTGESSLYLSIQPQTKASGSDHGNRSDDNTVGTLEIFIFRAEGQAAGALDTYKKFSAGELGSLTDLQITTTTGLKQIYAIANSHQRQWEGVVTHADFKKRLSSLQDEQLKSFTMAGAIEATLQSTTHLTFSISRLVSRVELKSLNASFVGTPYEGSQLQNVKIYLTNVVGESYFCNGTSPLEATLLNKGMAVGADISGCAMEGMLYESLAGNITEAGESKSHYFYCYPNATESENEGRRFTKLVIQADLNGTTYYYPLPIKNIERNCSYSVDVEIMRPGTLDPEQLLEKGVANVTLNVLDWVLQPEIDVEF